ncbi:hypothetical protein [Pseudomonas khavaziana]|uniref:hypothetical protein n=1 Tax=Pseudomonas khavaziana TaxID=2842351 RepID=UPI001C3DA79F|nr:hypothetical protein [Pseudomonas khavaziana]MBV4482641.1 hypothetical protein [Pseudomonas khavaziana]
MMSPQKKSAPAPAKLDEENWRTHFQAWRVPRAADFQALISLAEVGRQAVGLGEDLAVSGDVPTGLSVAGEGLPLQVVPAAGLHITSGVGLKVGAGLKVASDGLSLQLQGGLAILNKDVTVAARLPLSQENDALTIKSGNGVAVRDDHGLSLKLAPTSPCLTLSDGGLSVCCAPNGGLTVIDGKLTLDLEWLMDQ